ncbi:SPRY domain-containing protein 7-like [Lingula anatina]|uniref:SPRY domain-containing protein 7 n=1 Tax=Lingula anatina TaxID=7574 RepID=A0A1S3HQ09_LINAN|nr:SPRY domain-containing protein 7 [Lingula anatina]XP_013398892.1 SPRY domain-containing protein 7-like [Lingula anatina]|eukprot:XP_013387124.1 SPRY domain-containing protein 7 [Lingula anatina]
MANCFCCLRNWIWGGSGSNSGRDAQAEQPSVRLDTSHMGSDVVIVKNCRRICGTGAALANAPIVQDKAYFEIKLQSTGIWGVGLATKKCNLNTVPLGTTTESWVVRQDGTLYHNNEERGKLKEVPQEGDLLGLSYDHVTLNFYLNGKQLDTSFTGIKGTIYPVCYVDEGAILDVQFSCFFHEPPEGYNKIMIEQSLL